MTYDSIKAIPTECMGVRFRSRLEARWALFFERAGFVWEYEPATPILSDDTHYQPDFRIIKPEWCDWPQHQDNHWAWVEIKPDALTVKDFTGLSETLYRLCLDTGLDVILACGNPADAACLVIHMTTTSFDGGSYEHPALFVEPHPPGAYVSTEYPDGTMTDGNIGEAARNATKHRFPVR